ncbi:E3 ubiquitin-protein ligase ATL23-like [Solanum pennellii]|uniref:E3 ubiquitin-protein ligase ATL23-like n=1 Tax=Solanum pennellii TaxID=28526 RepID=A0ABM1HEB0_SOLPN|nr:E3 ubiquitin-protein ligase ATL23-like [Solanum pennellii]
MALLFFFYLYVVFLRGRDDHHSRVVIKTARKQGLSDVQLKKLPKIVGKDLSLDVNDCAICLDVTGNEEFARLVPGCKHGECVDLWLSKQPFCLVSRHKLEPELFNQDGNNIC